MLSLATTKEVYKHVKSGKADIDAWRSFTNDCFHTESGPLRGFKPFAITAGQDRRYARVRNQFIEMLKDLSDRFDAKTLARQGPLAIEKDGSKMYKLYDNACQGKENERADAEELRTNLAATQGRMGLNHGSIPDDNVTVPFVSPNSNSSTTASTMASTSERYIGTVANRNNAHSLVGNGASHLLPRLNQDTANDDEIGLRLAMEEQEAIDNRTAVERNDFNLAMSLQNNESRQQQSTGSLRRPRDEFEGGNPYNPPPPATRPRNSHPVSTALTIDNLMYPGVTPTIARGNQGGGNVLPGMDLNGNRTGPLAVPVHGNPHSHEARDMITSVDRGHDYAGNLLNRVEALSQGIRNNGGGMGGQSGILQQTQTLQNLSSMMSNVHQVDNDLYSRTKAIYTRLLSNLEQSASGQGN